MPRGSAWLPCGHISVIGRHLARTGQVGGGTQVRCPLWMLPGSLARILAGRHRCTPLH